MTSRGTFIVIEGLDRSGKSTQAAILHKKLSETLGEENVILMKFPDRTTTIGKMIDSYLRSESNLDDQVIHLLFSANRWELASSILSSLEAGKTIICDRYAWSGVCFSASKGLSVPWCTSPDIGLPAPDVVLFLDISSANATARGGYGEERYENESMQRTVRGLFKELGEEQSRMDGSWFEVDAGGTREEVSNGIWEVVERALKMEKGEPRKLWMHRLEQR